MATSTFLRAALVAPLAAPIVCWLDFSANAVWRGNLSAGGAFDLLALATVIGAPIAYAGVLILGVPGFLVARRFGFASRWGALLAGATIGGGAAFALAPSFRGELVSIPVTPWRGALYGAVVGLVWWQMIKDDTHAGERP